MQIDRINQTQNQRLILLKHIQLFDYCDIFSTYAKEITAFWADFMILLLKLQMNEHFHLSGFRKSID